LLCRTCDGRLPIMTGIVDDWQSADRGRTALFTFRPRRSRVFAPARQPRRAMPSRRISPHTSGCRQQCRASGLNDWSRSEVGCHASWSIVGITAKSTK